MKYKVLVLDIDGTLTTSKKEITERTKNALKKASDNGTTIVLASGRPTPGIIPIAKEIGFDDFGGYILAFNGGKIINYKTGEIIFQKILPDEEIPSLYKSAKENDVVIVSYDDSSIITENSSDEYVEIEARINKMPVKEVECFTEAITFSVPKCLMVGHKEHLANVEKIIQGKYGDRLSVYRSEPFFLEIMPQNIDKANSLSKLLEHINCTKEEMVACGDGFNDISMIKHAGLGVAMANAQPQVKENADFITLSNDEDGVAHIIEKFLI